MGELRTQRAPARAVRRAGSAPPGRKEPAGPYDRILQLQRQAGNQAVTQLLKPGAATAQRAPSLENPPVTTLHPSGTMNDAQWTAAYKAAVGTPTVAAYEALFRDIAVTAGMDKIPGFSLGTIPASDGKTAQPGLNITLKAGDTGHTAWVDRKTHKFGVPLNPTKGKAPDVDIAVILGPVALSADKGESLRAIRHEMVHVRHKLKVLDALKAWRAAPGTTGLDDWIKQQVGKKKMTELDAALVGKGAKDAASNTEVLGYVEGFTNDFHRRAATLAATQLSFFELLGIVITDKVYPWSGADPAVRQEALTRLKDYHGRLDPDHQRLWKEWLDRELGKVVKNQPGRSEFLAALTAFVV